MGASSLTPAPLVKGYFASLRSASTSRLSLATMGWHFVAPAAVAGIAGYGGTRLSGATAAAVATTGGLLVAFSFQTAVMMFDRAASWSESVPRPSAATSGYARSLSMLYDTTAYLALVSAITLGAALVAGAIDDPTRQRIVAPIVILLLAHTLVTALAVLVRLRRLAEARLKAARTGELVRLHLDETA